MRRRIRWWRVARSSRVVSRVRLGPRGDAAWPVLLGEVDVPGKTTFARVAAFSASYKSASILAALGIKPIAGSVHG
jgi:hypothetical protein